MIRLTEHYKKRYKERVSKSSKKMKTMANNAFKYGADLDVIHNPMIKKKLETQRQHHLSTCKIYRGYVWWFSATTVLTVYALPIIRASHHC